MWPMAHQMPVQPVHGMPVQPAVPIQSGGGKLRVSEVCKRPKNGQNFTFGFRISFTSFTSFTFQFDHYRLRLTC